MAEQGNATFSWPAQRSTSVSEPYRGHQQNAGAWGTAMDAVSGSIVEWIETYSGRGNQGSLQLMTQPLTSSIYGRDTVDRDITTISWPGSKTLAGSEPYRGHQQNPGGWPASGDVIMSGSATDFIEVYSMRTNQGALQLRIPDPTSMYGRDGAGSAATLYYKMCGLDSITNVLKTWVVSTTPDTNASRYYDPITGAGPDSVSISSPFIIARWLA